MKKGYLFVLLVVAFVLGACDAPETKEAYMEKFEAFVDDVAKNSKEYSDRDWEKVAEKYEKFVGEWYDKFKNDFTTREKINLTALKVRFNACRAFDKVAGEVKKLFESINVDKIKKQIQYYIDNDMDDDLKQLIEEAEKAGSEAEKAVEKILEELGVDKKKLEEEAAGKMDKLFI